MLNQEKQQITDIADKTISFFQTRASEFVEDMKHGAEVFKDLTLDAAKEGELTKETLQRNLGYGAVSALTDGLVTTALPKGVDPLQDSANTYWKALHHSFEHPPTLSGAIDRIKELTSDIIPDFKAKVDGLMTQIKNFKGD